MRTGLLQKDRLSRPDRLWLIKERLFLIILSRFAESSIEFSNELYDKKHILSFNNRIDISLSGDMSI